MLSLKQAAIAGLGVVALLATFVVMMLDQAHCDECYLIG
jgi:hypothetical protein